MKTFNKNFIDVITSPQNLVVELDLGDDYIQHRYQKFLKVRIKGEQLEAALKNEQAYNLFKWEVNYRYRIYDHQGIRCLKITNKTKSNYILFFPDEYAILDAKGNKLLELKNELLFIDTCNQSFTAAHYYDEKTISLVINKKAKNFKEDMRLGLVGVSTVDVKTHFNNLYNEIGWNKETPLLKGNINFSSDYNNHKGLSSRLFFLFSKYFIGEMLSSEERFLLNVLIKLKSLNYYSNISKVLSLRKNQYAIKNFKKSPFLFVISYFMYFNHIDFESDLFLMDLDLSPKLFFKKALKKTNFKSINKHQISHLQQLNLFDLSLFNKFSTICRACSYKVNLSLIPKHLDESLIDYINKPMHNTLAMFLYYFHFVLLLNENQLPKNHKEFVVLVSVLFTGSKIPVNISEFTHKIERKIQTIFNYTKITDTKFAEALLNLLSGYEDYLFQVSNYFVRKTAESDLSIDELNEKVEKYIAASKDKIYSMSLIELINEAEQYHIKLNEVLVELSNSQMKEIEITKKLLDIDTIDNISVKQLISKEDLKHESLTMKHCAENYGINVMAGENIFFHIGDYTQLKIKGEESTFDIAYNEHKKRFYISQHQIYNNGRNGGVVSSKHRQIAQSILEMIQQKYGQDWLSIRERIYDRNLLSYKRHTLSQREHRKWNMLMKYNFSIINTIKSSFD